MSMHADNERCRGIGAFENDAESRFRRRDAKWKRDTAKSPAAGIRELREESGAEHKPRAHFITRFSR
jgi:hypothetical protein